MATHLLLFPINQKKKKKKKNSPSDIALNIFFFFFFEKNYSRQRKNYMKNLLSFFTVTADSLELLTTEAIGIQMEI